MGFSAGGRRVAQASWANGLPAKWPRFAGLVWQQQNACATVAAAVWVR